MYKSRYDYRDELIRDDDIRAPLRKKNETSAGDALGQGRREPLETRAQNLLKTLPGTLSLRFCAEHYPHVVNRLAAVWHDSPALVRYIDGLLLNERGGRTGFAFDALAEMTELRTARMMQLSSNQLSGNQLGGNQLDGNQLPNNKFTNKRAF